MRKILFLCITICTMHTAQAQDTTHTLVKLVRPNYLGFYIAPEFQYGQLGGSFTNVGGGSAMLLINKKWGLGVTSFGTVNANFSPKDISPLYLRARFGGVRLEYTPRPNAAVHVTFPLTVGMSWARTDSVLYNNRGRNSRNLDYRGNNNERVFAQLGINVEGNLIRYAKIFTSASYRMSFNNGTSTTIPNSVLNGFSLSAGLKLGLFDLWIGKKQTAEN
jgi:hypothetical protein